MERTYTIRPLGHAAWASVTTEEDALREYGRAIDAGLHNVVILDGDGNNVTNDLRHAGEGEVAWESPW